MKHSSSFRTESIGFKIAAILMVFVTFIGAIFAIPLLVGLVLGLPLWLIWGWVAPAVFAAPPALGYLHFVGIVAFVMFVRAILFGSRSK